MYESGKGVPKDYDQAIKWYRLAAEQGAAIAQSNLGWMYANGHGVLKDYNEAIRWYRLAAEKGNAAAQNSLGATYETGRGVPQDYDEAINGIGSLLHREMPSHRIISEGCMQTDWVF